MAKQEWPTPVVSVYVGRTWKKTLGQHWAGGEGSGGAPRACPSGNTEVSEDSTNEDLSLLSAWWPWGHRRPCGDRKRSEVGGSQLFGSGEQSTDSNPPGGLLRSLCTKEIIACIITAGLSMSHPPFQTKLTKITTSSLWAWHTTYIR